MAEVIKRVFSVEVIDINEDGTPKLTKNKEFKFVTKEFAVRLPSYKVMEEANKLKGKVFRESLNDGDMLRDQLEDILRQKGLWNDQRQIEYDTLRKEILDRELANELQKIENSGEPPHPYSRKNCELFDENLFGHQIRHS